MADKVARIVHARNLGRIAYLPCLSIQNDTAREHLEYLASRRLNPSRNTLLFCEHNPVYTIGIRNKSVTDEEKFRLRALGAEFHHTNRGGLITFHGPGQLVCYPILNLACFKKSVRWYVARLEETLIATCKTFGVEARTTADTGVWVGNNKIAAIGIHASRWVTTHGIALNCNTDMHWFEHIVPCGITGKGVTSLTQETRRNIQFHDVVQPFIDVFQVVFDCEVQPWMDEG